MFANMLPERLLHRCPRLQDVNQLNQPTNKHGWSQYLLAEVTMLVHGSKTVGHALPSSLTQLSSHLAVRVSTMWPRESKKHATILSSISLPNAHRFLKLSLATLWKICKVAATQLRYGVIVNDRIITYWFSTKFASEIMLKIGRYLAKIWK